MPSWLLKAAVQGVISSLPASDRLNYLFQRHVTGSVVLSARCSSARSGSAPAIRSYQTARQGPGPPSLALELGTGWYPVVPVGLALTGVTRVVTVDVSSLLSPERTRQVLAAYAALLRSGSRRRCCPRSTPSARRRSSRPPVKRPHTAPTNCSSRSASRC